MTNKGDRYERKLVNALTENGWFAQRAAASGGGGDHELPDVIAAKDGRIEVIELKFSSDPPVYVSESKVAGLEWLADHLSGTPRLCLRMSGDTSFYAVQPNGCKRTSSGNYVLSESILSSAVVIAEA